jgi:hypothetical protein
VNQALAQGRARGALGVTFVGGEPTLHEPLPAWARHAREMGYSFVQVQTNARRLAYLAYARTLSENGVNELDVPLYGASAAAHDYHTRVPGSFAQTLEGLRNARAARLRLYVTLLGTRSNLRDLPETCALALRAGAEKLHIATVRPRGAAEADFDRVVPRLGLLGDFVAEAVRLCRQARVPVVVEGIPPCVLGVAADAAMELAHRDERSQEGRVHGAPCEACTYRPHCPGVYAEYARRVNLAELYPRRDPPSPRAKGLTVARVALTGFVGATHVEDERPEAGTSRPPTVDVTLVKLRSLGATNPGKTELRTALKRKTGDELRPLFPSLFGGAEPPQGKPE